MRWGGSCSLGADAQAAEAAGASQEVRHRGLVARFARQHLHKGPLYMTMTRTVTSASNPRSNMFEARVALDQMESTTVHSAARTFACCLHLC